MEDLTPRFLVYSGDTPAELTVELPYEKSEFDKNKQIVSAKVKELGGEVLSVDPLNFTMEV